MLIFYQQEWTVFRNSLTSQNQNEIVTQYKHFTFYMPPISWQTSPWRVTGTPGVTGLEPSSSPGQTEFGSFSRRSANGMLLPSRPAIMLCNPVGYIWNGFKPIQNLESAVSHNDFWMNYDHPQKLLRHMKIKNFFLGLNSPLSPRERYPPLPPFLMLETKLMNIQSVSQHCLEGEATDEKGVFIQIQKTIVS